MRDATADTASGMSQAYEEMSLRDLRKLAEAKETRTKHKGAGEWVNMRQDEIAQVFKAFDAKKGAQLLADPKTKLDKRKARQTSEKFKVKTRAKANSPKAKLQRSLRRRLWTLKQRAAERARQRTESYKETEKQGRPRLRPRSNGSSTSFSFSGNPVSAAGSCCAA